MRRGEIPAEAPPLESVISEDIELAAMDDEEAPGQQTEEIHRTGGRFTTWKGPSARPDATVPQGGLEGGLGRANNAEPKSKSKAKPVPPPYPPKVKPKATPVPPPNPPPGHKAKATKLPPGGNARPKSAGLGDSDAGKRLDDAPMLAVMAKQAEAPWARHWYKERIRRASSPMELAALERASPPQNEAEERAVRARERELGMRTMHDDMDDGTFSEEDEDEPRPGQPAGLEETVEATEGDQFNQGLVAVQPGLLEDDPPLEELEALGDKVEAVGRRGPPRRGDSDASTFGAVSDAETVVYVPDSSERAESLEEAQASSRSLFAKEARLLAGATLRKPPPQASLPSRAVAASRAVAMGAAWAGAQGAPVGSFSSAGSAGIRRAEAGGMPRFHPSMVWDVDGIMDQKGTKREQKGRDSKPWTLRSLKERSGREGPGKGGTARVARNKVQVESGNAAAGHQGRRPLQLPERQLFMRGNCLRELSAVEEKWLEGVAEESRDYAREWMRRRKWCESSPCGVPHSANGPPPPIGSDADGDDDDDEKPRTVGDSVAGFLEGGSHWSRETADDEGPSDSDIDEEELKERLFRKAKEIWPAPAPGPAGGLGSRRPPPGPHPPDSTMPLLWSQVQAAPGRPAPQQAAPERLRAIGKQPLLWRSAPPGPPGPRPPGFDGAAPPEPPAPGGGDAELEDVHPVEPPPPGPADSVLEDAHPWDGGTEGRRTGRIRDVPAWMHNEMPGGLLASLADLDPEELAATLASYRILAARAGAVKSGKQSDKHVVTKTRSPVPPEAPSSSSTAPPLSRTGTPRGHGDRSRSPRPRTSPTRRNVPGGHRNHLYRLLLSLISNTRSLSKFEQNMRVLKEQMSGKMSAGIDGLGTADDEASGRIQDNRSRQREAQREIDACRDREKEIMEEVLKCVSEDEE